MTVVFIGSKKAYTKFLATYTLSVVPKHVWKYDNVPTRPCSLLFDSSEQASPTWGPLIEFALKEQSLPPRRHSPDPGYNYRSYDEQRSYDERFVRRVQQITEKPNCLWCGKEFQTAADRDAHEESCGE